MVGEQRERGQLPIRNAGQRCLHENVAAELSLQHGPGRISNSRNGPEVAQMRRQQAAGRGERGLCGNVASRRAESATRPER